MANEYVLLKSKSEDVGIIALTKHAFELIVEYTVDDDPDVSLVLNKIKRPVNVKINDNKLSLSVDIKVKYGTNVNRVMERLQSKIAQNVLSMTEHPCNDIEISVVGFTF